eukprot:GHVS01040047.1.p1 GENE.GHVS01040047.1~~GHVS01040047.1.p1  ORF type:complete len:511 (+),score=50.04 GHVS01040047.1:196-1533(+)
MFIPSCLSSMFPRLAALLLFLSGLREAESIPCTWDMTIAPAERKSMNCGFLCPNPWGKKDPHYCGAPLACCCAPKCNKEKDSQENFVGLNWSDKYARLHLPRNKAFQILKHSGFYHIKTFSPDGLEDIIRAYGREDIHVYVGVPNKELTNVASDFEYAIHLVKTQLQPYIDVIRVVVVGNEPFLCIRTADWIVNGECGSLNVPAKLLPAMKNMRRALEQLGLTRPVSTAFNGGILEMSANPWTPCVSDYKLHLKPLLVPIWHFLRSQPAPFIVNLYSWFASMGGHIPPPLAVGYPHTVLPFDGQYNYYFNYDMQQDMQRVAMCVNEITDLELWIGETGWPSGEHPKGSNINAYHYFNNSIMRAQGMGLHNDTLDTVRFKGLRYVVFLFEAFDEDKKFEIEHGNRFENTFGLFYEDGTPKWPDEFGNLNLPMERKVNGPFVYKPTD